MTEPWEKETPEGKGRIDKTDILICVSYSDTKFDSSWQVGKEHFVNKTKSKLYNTSIQAWNNSISLNIRQLSLFVA